MRERNNRMKQIIEMFKKLIIERLICKSHWTICMSDAWMMMQEMGDASKPQLYVQADCH